MKILLLICTISFCVCLCSYASENAPKRNLAEYEKVLNLSEDQIIVIREILTNSLIQRDELLRSYNINLKDNQKVKLSFIEKKTLRDGMVQLGGVLKNKMRIVLNEKQFDDWKKKHAEYQQDFKAKLKNKIK